MHTMMVSPRHASLPLAVDMKVVAKDIEHHPDEPDHPHLQHTFDNSQYHGWRFLIE